MTISKAVLSLTLMGCGDKESGNPLNPSGDTSVTFTSVGANGSATQSVTQLTRYKLDLRKRFGIRRSRHLYYSLRQRKIGCGRPKWKNGVFQRRRNMDCCRQHIIRLYNICHNLRQWEVCCGRHSVLDHPLTALGERSLRAALSCKLRFSCRTICPCPSVSGG